MPYAKRDVLAGFPKEQPFESRDDLERYFSGNRVVCLLCGRAFRVLGPHLRHIHDLDSDEYRDRYGIPYMRGLCGLSFSEQRIEHGRRLYEENSERQDTALLRARDVQANFGNPQRHKPEFWKKERTKYGPEVFDEFLRRVRSGRSQKSVQNDPDMPTVNHVYWYANRNPGFAKMWGRRWDGDGTSLGPEFSSREHASGHDSAA